MMRFCVDKYIPYWNINLVNKFDYVIKVGNVENKDYLSTLRNSSRKHIKSLIVKNDFCVDNRILVFTDIHYPNEKISEFDYKKYIVLS
jgi:predicted phosphodiesterase